MTAFAFGTCRLRTLAMPQCCTFLHSLDQVLRWVQIIRGELPHPPQEWEPWVRHTHQQERWDYPIGRYNQFVVEVSSIKNVWCGPHLLHLSALHDCGIWPDRALPVILGRQPALQCDTADDIRRKARKVVDALGPTLFVNHETTRPWDARELIRDALASSGCQHFDPTTVVNEYGKEKCLLDPYHWTPWMQKETARRIHDAIDSTT